MAIALVVGHRATVFRGWLSLVDMGAKYGSVPVRTLFNDSSTYSRSTLPGLATEVRDVMKKALKAQFESIHWSLSPAAFVGDHWTDEYRQSIRLLQYLLSTKTSTSKVRLMRTLSTKLDPSMHQTSVLI